VVVAGIGIVIVGVVDSGFDSDAFAAAAVPTAVPREFAAAPARAGCRKPAGPYLRRPFRHLLLGWRYLAMLGGFFRKKDRRSCRVVEKEQI